ncbi:zinc finger protein crol gamma [Botrytis cinerea]
MASEQETISATVPGFAANLSDPATKSTPATSSHPESDNTRPRSLKRGRADQTQPPTTSLTSIANAGLVVSPSKAPRFGGTFSPVFPAAPLTGATAFEDERRKKEEAQKSQIGAMSKNPGHEAIASLLGGGGVNPGERGKPCKLGSTAQTATASPTIVASPPAMTNSLETDGRDARSGLSQLQAAMDEQPSNKSMSFPGNLAQIDPSQYPSRGMSLPMPNQNQQLLPRSPSQKKHKCPYCETEFTRHHNLKSHLLTHSQEKPYQRPRRLRRKEGEHGKFRRDDEFDGTNVGEADENGMDGIMYTNGNPHPNEVDMSEEDGRRFSLPSIKAQHVAGNSGSQDSYGSHSRTPSTYPPAGPRQNAPTGLYPPGTDRVGSSSSATSPSMQNNVIGMHTPSNSVSSMHLGTSPGSMFSQSGMTESPKPLSPAATALWSSSVWKESTSWNVFTIATQHTGTKTPGSGWLSPPDTRFTLSSQLSNQQSPGNNQQGSQQQQPIQQSSSPTSLFQPSNPLQSRGPPSHQGSGDSSNNLFASGASGVWAYVTTLEEKLKLFSDRVIAMEAKEKSQEEKIKAQDEKVNQLSEELLADASIRGCSIPKSLVVYKDIMALSSENWGHDTLCVDNEPYARISLL